MTLGRIQHISAGALLLAPALLLTTKNGSVVIVGLLVLFSIYYLIKNRDIIQLTKLDRLFVLSLSAYFLSSIPVTIFDGDSFRYFRGCSRILLGALIYLALRNSDFTHQRTRRFLEWGVMVGTIGAFILALYQYFIEGRPRVDGFLYSINFGFLSCALSFLAFCLAKHSVYKKFLYFCFFIGCLATLLTLTRGAILAIPMLLVLAIIINAQALKPKVFLLVAVLVSALCWSLYTYSPSLKTRADYTMKELKQTFINSDNIKNPTSMGVRVQLWGAASNAFFYRPLIGSTYKEREVQLKQMYELGLIGERPLKPRAHAHSQYFEMAASGGILGILAIILMLFVPFFYFLRHSRHSDYAYIGSVFVAGFCIYCLTEVALQQNTISTFYGFMLAVLLTFTQQELAEKKEE